MLEERDFESGERAFHHITLIPTPEYLAKEGRHQTSGRVLVRWWRNVTVAGAYAGVIFYMHIRGGGFER